MAEVLALTVGGRVKKTKSRNQKMCVKEDCSYLGKKTGPRSLEMVKEDQNL